jgi:hypothetical protein
MLLFVSADMQLGQFLLIYAYCLPLGFFLSFFFFSMLFVFALMSLILTGLGLLAELATYLRISIQAKSS